MSSGATPCHTQSQGRIINEVKDINVSICFVIYGRGMND